MTGTAVNVERLRKLRREQVLYRRELEVKAGVSYNTV
jgi:hypothetical protein